MPRFGKDKNARNEELDRQAAEEVERLTRRGAAPGGMPGMPGMGGGPPRLGPPSPLEMMAAEVADRPPPSQRRPQPARKQAPRPQQAFTAMPSGGVGSSFGPGGLNPGPRGAGGGAPPPSFGGGAYDDDFGGAVTGPPVYHAEPDEEEEMSITEMALMDHAARTGHNPEDLVMQYDASSAEEMRDRAMRQFYERQQSRGPASGTNDPFAPAGQRRGPSGQAPLRRREDPAAAGGALAQRLAARRRQEEEGARRAAPPEPPPVFAPAARPPRATVPSAAAAQPAVEREVDDGALARVLARRRAALGVDAPPAPADPPATSRPGSAGLRAVPEPAVDEEDEETVVEEAPAPARTARATKKTAPAAKKAPAVTKAVKAPAKKAPAKKSGATLAPAPAKKAAPAAPKKAAPAKKTAGKAKTIFCIECGEKNPAIAKFCFSCGTRLAAPEG